MAPSREEDGFYEESEDAPEKKGGFAKVIGLVVVIGAAASVGWYLYGDQMMDGREVAAVDLIRASETPIKSKPEREGGMPITDMDKKVYERIDGSHAEAETATLMEPPETPLEPPTEPLMPEIVPETVPEVAPVPLVTEAPAPIAAPAPVVAAAPAPAPVAAPAPAPAPEPAAPVKAPTPVAPTAEQVAPAPPPVVPEPAAVEGAYRLQLASVRSEAQARAEWARLVKAQKDLLGLLEPKITRVDLGVKGVFYRLQAGPVSNRTIAKKACEELKKRKVGCLIVRL